MEIEIATTSLTAHTFFPDSSSSYSGFPSIVSDTQHSIGTVLQSSLGNEEHELTPPPTDAISTTIHQSIEFNFGLIDSRNNCGIDYADQRILIILNHLHQEPVLCQANSISTIARGVFISIMSENTNFLLFQHFLSDVYNVTLRLYLEFFGDFKLNMELEDDNQTTQSTGADYNVETAVQQESTLPSRTSKNSFDDLYLSKLQTKLVRQNLMSEHWRNIIESDLFDMFKTDFLSQCIPTTQFTAEYVRSILTTNGWEGIIWAKLSDFLYIDMINYIVSPWMIDLNAIDIQFRDNIETMFTDQPMEILELQKTVSTCNYISNILKRKSIHCHTVELKSALTIFIELNFNVITTDIKNQTANDISQSQDSNNSLLLLKHATYIRKFKTTLDGVKSLNKNDYEVYRPCSSVFSFISILNRYCYTFLNFKRFLQIPTEDMRCICMTIVDYIFDSAPLRSTFDICNNEHISSFMLDEIYLLIIESIVKLNVKDAISKFAEGSLNSSQGLSRRQQNQAEDIQSLQKAVRAYKRTANAIIDANSTLDPVLTGARA
jgi:hypothetical protein